MPKLVGTEPYQVPRNADLGTMAYQDADSVKVNNLATANLTVSGNVGINTTSPAAILEVASNGSRLRVTQNTIGNILNGIDFASYTGVLVGGLLFNQASGEIRLNTTLSYFPTFYSNGVEVARFNTSGNFGIATTSPTANLHVVGTTTISGQANVGIVKTNVYTVATLPAAATAGAGARAYVSDSNTTTYLSIVGGSGANGVLVFSNGTNWLLG